MGLKVAQKNRQRVAPASNKTHFYEVFTRHGHLLYDNSKVIPSNPFLLVGALICLAFLPIDQGRAERQIHPEKAKAATEVHFVRCEYPIVLEPNHEDRTGCFIAIPIKRLNEKGCSVKFKMLVEEWDKAELEKFKDYPERDRHMALYMQRDKRKGQSGFCASARTLPVGKPCETTLNYSSKPPAGFYVSVHVAPWVKRVTILNLEISEGCEFMEKAPPANFQQKQSIAELIAQLDHDQFSHRDKAHRALVDFGWTAMPLLKEHLEDPDPERRVRVTQIIREIEKMEDVMLLQKQDP